MLLIKQHYYVACPVKQLHYLSSLLICNLFIYTTLFHVLSHNCYCQVVILCCLSRLITYYVICPVLVLLYVQLYYFLHFLTVSFLCCLSKLTICFLLVQSHYYVMYLSILMTMILLWYLSSLNTKTLGIQS